MNSLTDSKMILLLYEASKAGVKIDLIVRGICCLRPGVEGISDNIRVVSIVGRFLEHSRVFYCMNNGSPEIHFSSADLMGRNLNRRVELLFPIEDPAIAERMKRELIDTALRDNVRARLLNADGTHSRVMPSEGEESFDSQLVTIQSRSSKASHPRPIPREAPPNPTP
jgi:polyphosphate kinase